MMLRVVSLLVFLIVPAMPPAAQEPASSDTEAAPARLTVLVFEQGRPVRDLTMRVGDRTGRSDENGAWAAELAPGPARLTVFDTSTALMALPLDLRSGEIVQVIVTLRGENRRATVSIESSHSIETDALESPVAPVELEGSGILTGRVVSAEDGSPIADARLFVSGTPIEARTDDQGRYQVELPVGSYSVSVLHGDFATRTIDGVDVGADGQVERDFQLPPAGLELAEFVVIVPYVEGSLSAALDERRATASVVEVLGAEQMSRAGDGDAASALKRVTGLTLVGGKFIFIRGLGERYSSTLLNGHVVPSPDPTRKVVPLDLFPTGVIESIRIQKGFSPEFPGDFGGGAVQIRISGIPEENYLKVGLSTSIREGTTFQDGLTYSGGNRDFLGFDDGTRSLPDLVRQTLDERESLARFNPILNPDGLRPDELEELGESFANIYDPVEKEVGPDAGFSVEGGMVFDNNDWRYGFRSSVLWSDSYSSRDEVRRTFTIGSGQLQVTRDFDLQRTEREVQLSAAASFGIAYQDLHRIDANTMVLRLTGDEARIIEGFDDNERGNQQVRSIELEYEERQMIANQVRGEHRFPQLLDVGLNWSFSWAEAQRDAPDNRIVRFDNDVDSPTGFRFSQRADNNFRNFSDLTDETVDFAVDGVLPFSFGPVEGSLTGGWQQFERDRDSQVLRFQFEGIGNIPIDVRRQENIEDILNPDTIGPGGFFLTESTRPTDNSTALLDIDAWFANLDFTMFDRVRLSAGVRFEDWLQQSNTFRLFDPDRNPVLAELGGKDWFPSVSATWFITDIHQLRAGFAETLVRPDLRELSPAQFTDPVLDREVVGNADLVQSELQHFDLRYDWLFSPTELLSLGLFYKIIDDPIERGQQPGQERRISFNNVAGAEVYGAELELRKDLGFIGQWLSWLGWSDRFTFAGNIAYIESEISIDPEDAGVLTSTSRRLQGQSPYVINAQLAYDHPDERIRATILYNVTGERISEFGILGQPDLFEQPVHQLDLNLSWQMNDLVTFKFKAGNLLDAQFEIRQGDEIAQQYKRGRTWGLGLDFNF